MERIWNMKQDFGVYEGSPEYVTYLYHNDVYFRYPATTQGFWDHNIGNYPSKPLHKSSFLTLNPGLPIPPCGFVSKA